MKIFEPYKLSNYAKKTATNYLNYHHDKGTDILSSSLHVLCKLLEQYDTRIRLEFDPSRMNIFEISSSISHEQIQELKNIGIDAESQMVSVLSSEMFQSLSRELEKEENKYIYIYSIFDNANLINEATFATRLIVNSRVRFSDIIDERKRKLQKLIF